MLAKQLVQLKIRGLTATMLRHCRTFYLTYPSIHQTLSGESPNLLNDKLLQIRQTVSGEFKNKLKPLDIEVPPQKIITQLSFSHIVELLKIDDPLKRVFYEIETIKGRWSVRVLKRQMGSLLYERTGLSQNKEKVIALANESLDEILPNDLIRDPYIFEFLGLTPRESVAESDIESALLDHLQSFLLELGRGFCFEDRQRKILIGDEHFFIDLVFYHRILKCHVLVDLKVEPFSHANAGQLNTYINWFTQHEMQPDDNPPVGILLCTDRKKSLAKYALGNMNENLFVSQYQLQLPDQDTLQSFIDAELSEL